MSTHSSPEYQRAWRERNKERLRVYRERNKERLKEQQRAWRRSHREAVRAANRRWRDAHPGYLSGTTGKAAWDNWHAVNPERRALARKATHAVETAIRRGLLVRPSVCSECGREGRIEAAHHDYADLLNVRWLCRSCHVSWDRLEPKTKPAA